jgi:hypothetical protein
MTELPIDGGGEIADADEDTDEVQADHAEAFTPGDDIEEALDPPPDEIDRPDNGDES